MTSDERQCLKTTNAKRLLKYREEVAFQYERQGVGKRIRKLLDMIENKAPQDKCEF